MQILKSAVKMQIIITLIIVNILVYMTYIVVNPPGYQVNYDNIDPVYYNSQLESVIQNLPYYVIESLSMSGVEINIVSGKGRSLAETKDYVYTRLFEKSNTKSSEGTDDNKTSLGCYLPHSKQIYIFTDNIELTKSNSNYSFGFSGILNHELAHYIWHEIMTSEERQEIEACFASEELENFCEFTGGTYCKTNAGEFFAEYMKYYLDPYYCSTIDTWGTPRTQRVVEKILSKTE